MSIYGFIMVYYSHNMQYNIGASLVAPRSAAQPSNLGIFAPRSKQKTLSNFFLVFRFTGNKHLNRTSTFSYSFGYC